LSENASIVLFATVFLLAVAIGIVVLVLIYQKKQLQNAREREQLKEAFEREILSSRLEIQEQTFNNIAQEIHDNIGQVLSLARLTLNSIECSEPAVNEKVGNISVLVGKAVQDLRHLSRSMHTGNIAETGLEKAVKGELDMISRAANYSVNFQFTGGDARLPPQQELILFRIFQEAVNNIIKHARATSIDVGIHHSPDHFAMTIKDNGKGFDINNMESAGIGLLNIRNRTKLIGADLKIDTSPGSGTCISILLQ
jgi:signal transduction histidine kinase